ncbi:MAG: class I SAM-dependent methyltransferase [Chthoniobacteraceae bacterium]
MKIFGKEETDSRELTLGILEKLFGSTPLSRVSIRLWDGTHWPPNAPENAAAATVVLQHPGALREMFLANSEAALGEAYLRNDFDIEGDIEAAFELAEIVRAQTQGWSKKLAIAGQLWQLPARQPGTKNPRRADLQDAEHTLERDRHAVQFHYDLSNDFYGLWLDAARVYSCAYFQRPGDDLETAQRHKLDTICRKLGLKPGERLMDIGCGWGGLVLHAARHYGVRATGITLSECQAEYAREQIRAQGLDDQVEVRLQDYRQAPERGEFDAVVSVGMVEHVGRKNLPLYFQTAHRLLKPGGLFLNHGIGTGAVPGEQHSDSFIERYVFPDGDLFPLTEMNRSAEPAGFEIRDVENLREHYTLTLRHWVRRLEAHHAEALRYISEPVYRTWRVYMAGSAYRFASGELAIYQTLLAKLQAGGQARVPLDRATWYPRTRDHSRD